MIIKALFLFLIFLSSHLNAKFYPISQFDDWIVSIGDEKLPLELEKKLGDLFRGIAKEKRDENATFYVEGEIKNQILKHYKISKEDQIYYYIFGQSEIKNIEVSSYSHLFVRLNEAGGLALGTVGFKIPSESTSFKGNYLQGLASIGKKNPFEYKSFSEVDWEVDGTQKLKGQSVKRDAYADGAQIDLISEELLSVRVNNLQIFYGKSKVMLTDSYEELHFRMQIMSDKNKIIKDIFKSGHYSNPPDHVWSGKILKSDNQFIILSPTGMGSCGNLFEFKSDGKLIEHKLNCGSWGC